MSLHVVELTHALIAEMKKHKIRWHMWKGYIVLRHESYEYTRWHDEAMQDRLRMVLNPKISPELRYLLDTPYQSAIRELQEQEHVE